MVKSKTVSEDLSELALDLLLLLRWAPPGGYSAATLAHLRLKMMSIPRNDTGVPAVSKELAKLVSIGKVVVHKAHVGGIEMFEVKR